MSALAVVAAGAAGAAAGWFAGPAADAIATPRYGPDSPDHDPEDFELALLRAPTTGRVRLAATVLMALASALLAAELDAVDLWLYFAALSWAYVVAAVVDLQYLRLPDVITWPAVAVAVAGAFVVAARADLTEAAVPGPLVALGMAAFLWVFSLLFGVVRGQEAFGVGDLKLQLSLVTSIALLGWSDAEQVIGPVRIALVSTLAGFVIGVLAGLPAAGFKANRHVPFGPFLMAGWFVTVLLADSITG